VVQGAVEKFRIIIASSDSSVESKFSAVLEDERIEFLHAHRSAAPQSTTSKIHLHIGKRLQLLSKKGPLALKFFALIVRKAGELDVLTFQDFGLFMNWMGHVRGRDGDPLLALHLATERLQSTHRVIRKYNQCVRLARYAANSRHRWALPSTLLRVIQSLAIFIMRLRTEGQAEAAKQYRESAMQFCRMAVWISERNEDDESLSFAVTAVLLLTDKAEERNAEGEKVLNLARQALSKIGRSHKSCSRQRN